MSRFLRSATLALTLVCPLSASEAPAPPKDLDSPPSEAVTAESGLVHHTLVPGNGSVRPGPEDYVKVHYTGWLSDGQVFDSSFTRGKPVLLPVNAVIPGWQEGLQLMVEGEVSRLWIREELAYRGEDGRPAGDLVFDVELLGILDVPKPPSDVATIPTDAERSKSGLAWRVLREGEGQSHPKKRGKVEVHYTGWTTDGEQFDSSIPSGRPALFPLDKVIKGWTEGVALMVEGERRLFWIPEKLAYKGKKGSPQGMLVFDIELVNIVGK